MSYFSKIKTNYFSTKKLDKKFLLGITIGLIMVFAFILNITMTTRIELPNQIQTININAPAGPVVSTNNLFTIDYNDDNVTLAEVNSFAGVLEDAYFTLVDAWGMQDPNRTGNNPGGPETMPPIHVYISTDAGLNGWAHWYGDGDDYYWMSFLPAAISSGFSWDEEPFYLGAHELFHCTQLCSPGPVPKKWILEGQARMQQDRLSPTTDTLDGTEFAGFLGDVRWYLQNSHRQDLTTLSYSACLFWSYLCEQFGDNKTDTWNGIDAVATFWDTTVNSWGTDGITMINNMLSELNAGKNFKHAFEDFSVAIYAKDLDETTIPSKWYFRDDDDTGPSGNYWSVGTEISSTLTSTNSLSDNDEEIEPWSNKFYEVDIDPTVDVITIQFNQTTNHKLYYALLAMDGDDCDYYYTTESKDFRRAIVNNNYDKIVVVVAGLEDDAEYKYLIEGGLPEINIESPLNSPKTAQARVGAHDNPEKFLSIIDVNFRKTAPVHGFFKDNFLAQVGGENATILSATDVYGKYFLVIQAPIQPANGLYNLKVELVDTDGVSIDYDVEEPCVNYNETAYDLMVAIDKSGSMGSKGKLLAAKSAGKLFVNSFLSEDQLGVVEFDTTANVIHNLLKLTTTNRNNAIAAINGISVGVLTSLGDALFDSQEELITGIDDNPDHIILLSDGVNTYAPDVGVVKPIILGNNTVVHAVTIGVDAAYDVMQNLAADTGGTYFYCFDPASGDIPNDLAEIYRGISEEIKYLERFYHARGTVSPSDTKRFYLDVTDDMDYIEFTVHYNGTAEPTVQLEDPSSSSVSFTQDDYNSGMGHAVYQKANPASGTWQIAITENSGSDDLKYFVEGAAHTSVNMELLTPPNGITSTGWGNIEMIGTPIPFLVSLSDQKPISDAEIRVTVTPPGAGGPNKTHNEIFEIPLYDDGNHGDGYENDGVFGGLYTPTSEEGGYQFIINATGKTNDDTEFMRIRTGAFTMYDPREKPDLDNDGLPTNWEEYYGLDPNDATPPHNGTGDPDNDGLINMKELFYGTDPLNGDTDFGGEGDNAEVLAGRNPLDPEDDTIGRFPAIRVYPGDGFVYLAMPNATHYPQFIQVQIFRSTDPVYGFTQIGFINMTDLGYNDTGVSNYNTYYYRVKGLSTTTANGLSKSYGAMPMENILGPEGCLIINNGNSSTDSNGVTLTIRQIPNDLSLDNAFQATHMRISNNPKTLDSQPWLPFQENYSWILTTGEDYKFVYVQLKDSQTVPSIGAAFSAGIYYTGAEEVGPETYITVFLIIFDLLVISVIYYKKKKQKIKIWN